MTIKIFLADDHAVVRDGLRALLEAHPNLEVVGDAANGQDAVDQVTGLRPDVVILDIAMPELNGIEATRKIIEACPDTQVIILSMHSTSEHVFRALQAGARAFLLKESAGQEVVNAIEVVYAGQRYLNPKISNQLIDDYLRQRESDVMASPLARLSPREREILQLVAEGKSSAEIAQILFLSPKTVETYRSRLMKKLGLQDLAGLVKFAIQHELISLE